MLRLKPVLPLAVYEHRLLSALGRITIPWSPTGKRPNGKLLVKTETEASWTEPLGLPPIMTVRPDLSSLKASTNHAGNAPVVGTVGGGVGGGVGDVGTVGSGVGGGVGDVGSGVDVQPLSATSCTASAAHKSARLTWSIIVAATQIARSDGSLEPVQGPSC